MLQIKLTDGQNKCTGIEFSSLGFLKYSRVFFIIKHSLMTNPGSKLEIVDCDVLNGRLLLTPSSCKPLGGYVESIVEVWKNNEVFEELILTH